MQAQQKIAFLGMGLMGSRMATRLLHAGFEVAVWNRTPTACDALKSQGATRLNLNEIADYPIVLLCLADDTAVHAVFEQIEPFLTASQILVDFSSITVESTQHLAQQAKGKHATWIDSPVSGGTIGAEQGSLVVFAGGDEASINVLRPIYATLSQRVTYMGASGTGQATKLCNQLIVAATSTLIAEAIALATKANVDTHRLADALRDGFADSKPFQILAPRMATQCFEPVQWKVQTLNKDLSNAIQLAQHLQLQLPVAEGALKQLSDHQQQGYATQDLSTLIQHIKA
ncbi:NAD(P)-dependent oxidoreductase [Acinetobacter sp. MD2(2019)]|uniref:NAD(P)-dependent oxidoreductase n=1 Tax=Acinetobacter sp. MD2(2019) TaxID=2605273 RepID=UPI002D1EE68E|nr:NAD(P)-dependent oxidoreductase [Acinetobacter sp. MD2(2019)]MEB3754951.1 NAD(P)-dependent oxidoreductase [Acinetobacter sp. MD2(2019)]